MRSDPILLADNLAILSGYFDPDVCMAAVSWQGREIRDGFGRPRYRGFPITIYRVYMQTADNSSMWELSVYSAGGSTYTDISAFVRNSSKGYFMHLYSGSEKRFLAPAGWRAVTFVADVPPPDLNLTQIPCPLSAFSGSFPNSRKIAPAATVWSNGSSTPPIWSETSPAKFPTAVKIFYPKKNFFSSHESSLKTLHTSRIAARPSGELGLEELRAGPPRDGAFIRSLRLQVPIWHVGHPWELRPNWRCSIYYSGNSHIREASRNLSTQDSWRRDALDGACAPETSLKCVSWWDSNVSLFYQAADAISHEIRYNRQNWSVSTFTQADVMPGTALAAVQNQNADRTGCVFPCFRRAINWVWDPPIQICTGRSAAAFAATTWSNTQDICLLLDNVSKDQVLTDHACNSARGHMACSCTAAEAKAGKRVQWLPIFVRANRDTLIHRFQPHQNRITAPEAVVRCGTHVSERLRRHRIRDSGVGISFDAIGVSSEMGMASGLAVVRGLGSGDVGKMTDIVAVVMSLHSDLSAAQGAPEASRPSATDPRADIVRRGLPTCWISTKIHF
ncbi:hypothetical protein DFH08DRAFT_825148 [Mycena albidolilacea]|uniref:Uncharacterized protein n=1 Tax=Mycena albidolilacea TaxID=1033008 RepID=A0AAD7E9S3_9AGAR|nr:hypothetical protein DFH08DRAFT_825148 [Mycena albidolilacea]